ncbi:hypothetical protein HDV01_003070 [Terramyces sp. JEL0728]|nr:hypothetical protein HDV01_003070 [Terramyces sp. JEL0728]
MIFPIVKARGIFDFANTTKYLENNPTYAAESYDNHTVLANRTTIDNYTLIGKPDAFLLDYAVNLVKNSGQKLFNSTPDVLRIPSTCMAFFTAAADQFAIQLQPTHDPIEDFITFSGSLNIAASTVELLVNNPQFAPTKNSTITQILTNGTVTQLNVTNANGSITGNLYSNSDNAVYAGKYILDSVSFQSGNISMETAVSGLINSQFTFNKTDDTIRLSIQNATLNNYISANSSVEIFPISGSVEFAGISSYIVKCSSQIVMGDGNDGNSFTFTLPVILALSFGFALIAVIISLSVIKRHFRRRVVPISGIPMISFDDVDMNTRITRFLEMYPPNTQEAKQAAKDILHTKDITMMQPIVFPEFPFALYPPPTVEISGTTKQNITIKTTQPVSIQCSQAFQPQTQLLNNPPPSFEPTLHPNVYIEVEILKGNVCLGFATMPYPSFVLAGYETQSLAYHSKDGKVYLNSRYGIKYGAAKKIGVGYRVAETMYNEHVLKQIIFYFCLDGLRVGDELVVEGVDTADLHFICGSDSDCSFQIDFGDMEIHQ